jgi:hypothetical protein
MIEAPSDYGLQSVTDVTWAFKGSKYYEQVTDTKDVTQQNAHQKADAKHHRAAIRIFDGKEEHHFESTGTAVRTGYHHDDVHTAPHINFMSPLDCGYLVNGKWIATALKAGHGSLVGTAQDHKFGLLSILTCQSDNNSTIRFWIAPKYNYMSVRTELSYPFPNKPNTSVVETLRCLSAVKVDSIWMPGVCSIETVRRTDGSDALQSKVDYKNISYQVNNVSDSRFDATMSEGSVLYDGATQTRYSIGAHGKRIFEERYATASPQAPFPWHFLVGLSIFLVLLLGAQARWRRPTVQI